MPNYCVDRTFLLKQWDSKGKIDDMPYHLEVKYFSGEAHLLIAGST